MTTAIQKGTPDVLQELLGSKISQIRLKTLLGDEEMAKRFARIAVNCVEKSIEDAKKTGSDFHLGKCSPGSLVRCAMVGAELGLEPGGALGHLYFVPFGGEATPVIGYRGFVELAYRSGKVSAVRAVEVHERDEFEVSEGLYPTLKHIRCLKGDPGPITHVYAVAKLKGGETMHEIMSVAEVEKVRAKAKSANSPAWKEHWGEMAKKTVFRRLAKFLPLTEDRWEKALSVDNEDYIDSTATPVPTSGVTTSKERIKAKLAETNEVAAEPSAEVAT